MSRRCRGCGEQFRPEFGTQRICWPCFRRASDMATAENVDVDDVAVAFLRGALADGEWHEEVGLLQEAARALHVEHEQRGSPPSTWWRLPRPDSPLPSFRSLPPKEHEA